MHFIHGPVLYELLDHGRAHILCLVSGIKSSHQETLLGWPANELLSYHSNQQAELHLIGNSVKPVV